MKMYVGEGAQRNTEITELQFIGRIVCGPGNERHCNHSQHEKKQFTGLETGLGKSRNKRIRPIWAGKR